MVCPEVGSAKVVSFDSSGTFNDKEHIAPTQIGSVSVGLTVICTDMTCAAFKDSSSVLGGSRNAVLKILAYAASKSNVGGSLWYSNVKSSQELIAVSINRSGWFCCIS